MNYGETDMQSNMYVDDDSIELLGFFRKPNSKPDSMNIKAILNGQTKQISIASSADAFPKGTSTEDANFEFVSIQADESLSTAPLHAAKTIGMEITRTKTWNSMDITLEINADDIEKITICSLQVSILYLCLFLRGWLAG